jgi:hypothetical protein
MNAERILQFVADDHPITYSYQKVILQLKDGKTLHGFFNGNTLHSGGDEYLKNRWNFEKTPDRVDMVIEGNTLESISLYRDNRLVYKISDHEYFNPAIDKLTL